MFTQIAIGTAVIFITIVIQVVFVSIAIEVLTRFNTWFVKPPFFIKTTMGLVGVVLWLVAGISISAWSWAGVFLLVGAFEYLEPALYFSVVTFTTLGYGDVTLNVDWRILASFAAVNGLIIFGLNTAFIVEFSNRLRSSQENIGATASKNDHGKNESIV